MARKVRVVTQPTVQDIDEALARIVAGRGDPACDATIERLLDQRVAITGRTDGK